MLPEFLGLPQMLGIYWTLEVEVVSYAVVALLFVSGLMNNARLLTALCFVLIGIFALVMFGLLPPARILQWQMLPHNLALIAWGNLFHLSFAHPKTTQSGTKSAQRLPQALTLLTGVLVLTPSFYSLLQYALKGNPDNLRWGIAYPVAMALFVVTYFKIREVPRALVWMGQISYSSYLLHTFVITMLVSMLQTNSTVSNFVGVPLFALLSLVTTTLCASISFAAIEKPAMRLGKRLAQWNQRRYCTDASGTSGQSG
jgi:peptidoglycan/LPS O-acetylase OafA/YrhL